MSDRFELPAELNIYGALEIRDALLAWVTEKTAKGGDYLEISARDVAEVDGSGLQLLASLSNMGQSWRLVEASEVFSDACRTLGFAEWLEGRHIPSKSSGAAK
jgi:ABC-type transporter Mla MlaB component